MVTSEAADAARMDLRHGLAERDASHVERGTHAATLDATAERLASKTGLRRNTLLAAEVSKLIARLATSRRIGLRSDRRRARDREGDEGRGEFHRTILGESVTA